MERPPKKNDEVDATLLSPGRPAKAEGTALPPLGPGRYQVDEGIDALLGKGGQGAVWLARDRLLRRDVAVKLLHEAAQRDPAMVAAFIREARLTALLEHQGIVPLHDVGVADDGSPAIVLRRIQGQSLAETLNGRRTLDERLPLVPALLRACQAVAFAHQRHVVHRDLKPQNVMLGPLGETYVLDWGLAVVESDAAAPDITAPQGMEGVVGTPAYMSPEQALGLAADARSDVWGLGACLYQLLTGQPPIAGRSVQSAMAKAVTADVVPVRLLEPGAPLELAAICEKALSTERSARYATAEALAEDLERWLAGRTVSAHAYSRVELLKRALHANRTAFVVGLVALLALAVGLGVDEVRVRGERNLARDFARDLLVDTSAIVQTRKADIRLVGMLSTRALQWLERGEFGPEEQTQVCKALINLANLNYDAQQWAEGRELDRRALSMGEAALARAPDDPRFFVCLMNARTDLAYAELQVGDAEAGKRAYEAAAKSFTEWPGARTPALSLAHADFLNAWGSMLWDETPTAGAERFVAAAALARDLLQTDDSNIRASALGFGANGTMALWSQGRRAEALELARVFSEQGDAICQRDEPVAQTSCLTARAAFQQQLAWADDPRATVLLEEVLRREKEGLEREPDSTTMLHDAMWTAFERGDFAASSRFAEQLRERHSPDGFGLGGLATVLAGRPLDTEETEDSEGKVPQALARALQAASNGHFAEAASTLRGIDHASLWYQLSWTPHPKPALVMPAKAKPAFEKFLADFTSAYREAEHEKLGESIDALAEAFDALAQ